MLALPLITTCLSLVSITSQPHEPVQLLPHNVAPPHLVPYGDLVGAWASATAFQDGFLTGVMTDAAGTPLWVLDATLGPGGAIGGRLLPLEYATNPALGLLELAVQGQAQIAADGTGRFSAVLFSPYLDPAFAYVYPLGQIQGLLVERPLGHAKPGPGGGTNVGGLHVQSAGARALAPGKVRAGAIVCPQGPDPTVASIASAAKRGLASKLPTRAGATSLACTKGPAWAVSAVGQVAPHGQAGHAGPGAGSGVLMASWILSL